MNPHWFDAIHTTALDNVSVYLIDPEGQAGELDDYSQGFAELTGGRAWVNSGRFDQAVDQIWRESGSYYLIGYRAPINNHRLHRMRSR